MGYKRKLKSADGAVILPFTTNVPVAPNGGLAWTSGGTAEQSMLYLKLASNGGLSIGADGVYINGATAGGSGAAGSGGGASISIGNTVTLSAGSGAYVTSSLVNGNIVLNFGIPRGSQGVQGPQGPQGSKGDTGATGSQGPAGSDGLPVQLHIGTVTTVASTSNAAVSISDPVSSGGKLHQTLDFSIPRGSKGETGATGADGSAGAISAPVASRLQLTVPEDISGQWYLHLEIANNAAFVSSGTSMYTASGSYRQSNYGGFIVYNGEEWSFDRSVQHWHAGMPVIVDLTSVFSANYSRYFDSQSFTGYIPGAVRYYWEDSTGEQMTDPQSIMLGAAPGAVNPVGMAAGAVARLATEAVGLTEVIDSSASVISIQELYGGVLYTYTNPVSSVYVSSCTPNSIGDIIHFTAATSSVNIVLNGSGLLSLSADSITSGAQYDVMVCNNRVAIKKTTEVV